MHKFKDGPLAGMTTEQAMLRNAPHLYQVADWAEKEKKPWHVGMLNDFQILRWKLALAKFTASCSKPGCKAAVRFMTLPVDSEGYSRASPYFWCPEHEPWERNGIGEKIPIHFDAIRQLKTKREKNSLFRKVRKVIGIRGRTRITEEFARKFFAGLDERAEDDGAVGEE